jgi:dimethylaniline monooxygenase (N-oxide forming)
MRPGTVSTQLNKIGPPQYDRSATKPKACIVGDGSSGVTVAKVLRDKGVLFDCFEKGTDVGGMWRYDNDNGM